MLLALAVAGLGLTLPTALDFGVKTGSAPPYQSQVVAVQNNTRDAIWIARVAPAGDPSSDFRVVADSCSPHSLQPGATCSVTVEFAPSFRSGSAQIDDQLLFWGDGPTYQAVRLRGVYDGGHATGGGPPVALGFLVIGGLLLFYLVAGVIVATFLVVGAVIVVNVARRSRQ